jgi:hypothetical protein
MSQKTIKIHPINLWKYACREGGEARDQERGKGRCQQIKKKKNNEIFVEKMVLNVLRDLPFNPNQLMTSTLELCKIKEGNLVCLRWN